MERSIIQYGQLNENQKLEVVEIFVDGFGHLMSFSKDREVLKQLFLQALNPLYIYALVEKEKVVGIKTSLGIEIKANAVILTNGTFLNSTQLEANETKELCVNDEVSFANIRYWFKNLF